MRVSWAVAVIVSILIFGTLADQNVFAASTLILAPSAQIPGKAVTIIVTEVPDGTPVNVELNGINILTGTAGTFDEFFKSVIIPITTTAGEGVITAKWTVGTDNFMLSEPFTVLPLPVVDFTNQGVFTTEQISESGVTITGSNTLNIKSIIGLGVVGGVFDSTTRCCGAAARRCTNVPAHRKRCSLCSGRPLIADA